MFFFFFNDTATTEIYTSVNTLSLHDALPICTGGDPDSIPAPATAKNVITVGAIEQLRNITNAYTTTEVVNGTNVVSTNTPFLGFTDSDNVVASFSSRGNVGIGTEGDFGRVKPDVVAPGAFVVSTR